MIISNVTLLGTGSNSQTYSSQDLLLIPSAVVSIPFGTPFDHVNYTIYDENGEALVTVYESSNYVPIDVNPNTGTAITLQLDPEADVAANGYNRGTVEIEYSFSRYILNSDTVNRYRISEISSDRTEIRVIRPDLSNAQLQQAYNEYVAQSNARAYYPDYYLNFNDTITAIGVNIAYVLVDNRSSLLIKLYEPLPPNLQVKDTFWTTERVGESIRYRVSVDVTVEEEVDIKTLRGPNFNIGLTERIAQTTPLYNYNNLFRQLPVNSTQYAPGTTYPVPFSASFQQIKSLLDEKGLDINIDYTNFKNFVHFSSATERLYNFAYKLNLIEGYRTDIAALSNVASNNGAVVSSSRAILEGKIDDIITKFDGYEYYLYFESGSFTWPKTSTYKPFILAPTTSSQAIDWLGDPNTIPTTGTGVLYSASLYDVNNKDWLINTIPEYLKADDTNIPYQTFLNMVGQHFDNIWVYLKDVTERFNANNSIEKGVSKELVGDALKALGIKLYTNTSIYDNIYYMMLGINPDGTNTPPTGSEVLNYFISYRALTPYVLPGYVIPYYVFQSSTEIMSPGVDITLEYYKRLYHNLPYLLKTRGTMRGLRALINCFGIPDTVLRINEFGGSDKSIATPDLLQNRYYLAYDTSTVAPIYIPWVGQNLLFVSASNKNIVPDTIEFRFKSKGVPTSQYTTQSLFQVSYVTSGATASLKFGVNLIYDEATAVPSSSYQYDGNLRLYLSGSAGYAITSPITFPYYDPNRWWNVMIKRDTGSLITQNTAVSNRYWVYVKSAGYDEEGNGEITFEGSQSITVDGSTSASYNNTWNTFSTSSNSQMFRALLGGSSEYTELAPGNRPFQGYMQEFRYWSIPLEEDALDEHTRNSLSYRGNRITGSSNLYEYPYDLTFRLPLGNNLNVPYLSTSSVILNPKDYDLYQLNIIAINSGSILNSYHPTVTGSFSLPFNNQFSTGVPSFISGSTAFSYALFPNTQSLTFTPFTEYDLIATPATGISQKVNNKVSVPTVEKLQAKLLSPFTSLQKPNLDMSANSADLEVGFSFTDNIDEDIINEIGYFNIDDYIGNPTDATRSTYPELDALKDSYFQKYLRKYNISDYIRLIKYYDNSLFKMIKDFVPARSNVTTGVIVKPHILERPKYARNEPITVRYNNLSASIDMLTITGSNPEASPTYRPCTRYKITGIAGSYGGGIGGGVYGYTQCTGSFPEQFNILQGQVVYVDVQDYSQSEALDGNMTIESQGPVYYDPRPSTLNTSYTSSIITPLGRVVKPQNDLREPFTGEFSGSSIVGTLGYFPQTDISSITTPWTSSVQGYDQIFTTYSLNPLLNNATGSNRSIRFLDADYSSNQIIPVNEQLISSALALYPIRNTTPTSQVLSSIYWPFATVNDYDYETQRWNIPRYIGSKTISAYYNLYALGDNSYGNTAAIDKIKEKYAYLATISTSSILTPGRTNAQIKYLIDNDENTINLTKVNANLFDIQNIYKSGEYLDIALFNYTDNASIRRLSQNARVYIAQGGFRYYPILHNISGSHSSRWQVFPAQPFITYIPPGTTFVAPPPGVSDISNYQVTWYVGSPADDSHQFQVEYIGPGGTSTTMPSGNYTASITIKFLGPDTTNYVGPRAAYLNAGTFTTEITENSSEVNIYAQFRGDGVKTTSFGGKYLNTSPTYTPSWYFNGSQTSLSYPRVILTLTQGTIPNPNAGVPVISYLTSITSSADESCLYLSGSNTFVIRGPLAQYYSYSLTFDSLTDPWWDTSGMENSVTPFILDNGDEIHLWNSQLGWSEYEEYYIKSSNILGSGTSSRLYIEVDRNVNINSVRGFTGSLIDPIYGWDTGSCRFIIAKKIPDETNIVVRYAPEETIAEEGLLYPQYLDDDVKLNSGNVIQSLKANLLI